MKTLLAVTLVITLFFVMSLSTVVSAQDAAYVPDEILIGVKKGTAQDVIQRINARLGAKIIRKFRIIDAYQLQMPQGIDVPKAINFYSRQPVVEYAEPNYIVYADATPNDPRFDDLWGLHNTGQTGGTSDADIDALEAWKHTVGSEDIVVASIDTGVDYRHEDLKDNMWVNIDEANGTPGVDDDGNGFIDDIYGYDFRNNDGDPMDDHGHGTHTSGTIGAVGDNGIGVVGVCWEVKIMALKFLSASGSGTTGDAIECIEYATMMGAHLTNNSWGGGGYSQALYDVIAEGPLFMAAAGNSGVDTDVIPHYPSSYDLQNIISVAATDHNDGKAGFSNYGLESVDLGAPGVGTLSTLPGNSYGSGQGTSMAAPHVAGVAALIMSVSRMHDLRVKWIILTSVDKIDALEGKVLTGGRLNAKKAARRASIFGAPSIAIGNNKALTKVNPAVMTSSLGNAFPSPANPEVWIPYQLNSASDVLITIYDISGKMVRQLNLGHRSAGIYENKQLAAHWNGRNINGEIVASGFYFYTIKAGDFTETRKLFIVR